MRFKIVVMSLVTLILTSALPFEGTQEAYAGNDEALRLMLTPRSGDALNINLPGNPGEGGFTGPIYTVEEEMEVGSFTTDIITCTCVNIFDLLTNYLPSGIAIAEEVAGQFELKNGTIFDRHRATVIVLPEPPVTLGYDVVVAAIGDGVITDGTGKYKNASGITSLYLKMEVDLDGGNPARAMAGSFLFDFD